MSFLLWRHARVLATARPGTLSLTGDSRLRFRTGLGDLDVNMHMNNGRYLSIMDLGRLDWLVRTGLGRLVVQKRWRPMVGSATIRYASGLAPFSRFELHTRLAWWDEKWFYFEQRFVQQERTVARGWIKGLLRSRDGNVPSSEIVEHIGAGVERPPQPPGLAAWMDAEVQLAPGTSAGGAPAA